MSPQPEFLVKWGPKGPRRITQFVDFFRRGDETRRGEHYLRVSHPEINRLVSSRHVEGLGTINRVEGTKRYRRDLFRLSLPGGTRGTEIRATAAGLKATVRRIREQEAAELDVIDCEIEKLTTRLAAIRSEREEMLAEAFARGHVVRLNEVEPFAVDGF